MAGYTVGMLNMVPAGTAKISAVFWDYAQPLVQALPKDASPALVEKALQIAFATWNAVILEQVQGKPQSLELARQLVADHPALAGLIEFMLERKRTVFAQDHRLIGEFKFVPGTAGQLNLRVVARSSYTHN